MHSSTPNPLLGAGSHAGQASRPAAQKRSFEDLMSGGGGLGSSSSNNSNGTTTFGFGQSSSAPTLAAFATAQKPWSQQPFELKKHKTGLGEASVNGSAGQQNTGAGISAAMQDPKTKPALPAFLQAAQVAETYGGSLAAKQNRTQ